MSYFSTNKGVKGFYTSKSNRKYQYRQNKKLQITNNSFFIDQKPTIKEILQSYEAKKEPINKLRHLFNNQIKNSNFASEKTKEKTTQQKSLIIRKESSKLKNNKILQCSQTNTKACQKDLQLYQKLKNNLKELKRKQISSINNGQVSRKTLINFAEVQWYSKLNKLNKQRYNSEKLIPFIQSRQLKTTSRYNSAAKKSFKRQKNKTVNNTIHQNQQKNCQQAQSIIINLKQKLQKRYHQMTVNELIYDNNDDNNINFSSTTKRKICSMRQKAKTQSKSENLFIFLEKGW